jgi:hypothetical protein
VSHPPFLIFALPRSRTYWLSKFLSYGDWSCSHDELRHMRTLDDVRAWLKLEFVGSVETSGAYWWRLLAHYRSEARVVVIRRPVDSVVESLMALDMRGSCMLERGVLTKAMQKLDAKLDQIEARIPNVLSVQFDDLERESACARVFEHCLPYSHDQAWWAELSPVNMHINFPTMVRYAKTYGPVLERLARTAKQEILGEFAKRKAVLADGLVIQTEPFAEFLRGGKSLFAEHSISVGELPDSYLSKNISLMERLESLGNLFVTTARCNGRMFGYLMTVISPSLESPKLMSAVHTAFYASPSFPGLGMKLQRAALATLRNANVDELFMVAGVRAGGPRTSAIYRRLGAASAGEAFRIELRGH